MRNRLFTTLVSALVIVGGLNVAAYAATGGTFILGRSNSANKTTALANTASGPALKLQTRSASPPLAVTSSKKVVKLNADKVDGKDATSLQTRPMVYSVPSLGATGRFALQVPLSAGAYQISYSILADMSAAGASINCFWNSTFEGTVSSSGYGYGSQFSDFSSSNSTTTALSSGTKDWLECFASGGTASLTASAQNGSQIIVTKVNSLQFKGAATSITPPRPLTREQRAAAQGR